jgi:hypothetical protein
VDWHRHGWLVCPLVDHAVQLLNRLTDRAFIRLARLAGTSSFAMTPPSFLKNPFSQSD